MTNLRTALATVLARQVDDLINEIEAGILIDINREENEAAHMDCHIFYEVVVPVLDARPTSLIMIRTFTNDTNYCYELLRLELREKFRKYVIRVLGIDPRNKAIAFAKTVMD